MEFKLFEIRDKGTFIPALAIRVSSADGWLMRRAGFGAGGAIYLVELATQQCAYDPFVWGERTMGTAHQFIEREWGNLNDGAVLDVQFILGETLIPKRSERDEGAAGA